MEVVPWSDKPGIKRPIQVLHAPELQARLATRLHISLPPGSERKKRRSPDHAEPNLVLPESCRRGACACARSILQTFRILTQPPGFC